MTVVIEPPSRAVRDYLAGFGLGCILVRPTSEIQVASNWGRAPIAAVLWVRDQKTAWQVVRAIGEARPSSVEAAITEIRAAAARVDVVLSEHSVVVARAQAAIDQLGSKLSTANANGDLKFFNRAYRQYRLGCLQRGEGAMPYGTAMARLRKLLAGAAAGAPVSDVVRRVFT
jgi:hypothetical protein